MRGGAPSPSVQALVAAARPSPACSRLAPHAAAAQSPTVADTKRKFVEAYKFPIPAVYGNVLQELLVTQHLTRYNVNYAYTPVRMAQQLGRGGSLAWIRGFLGLLGAARR